MQIRKPLHPLITAASILVVLLAALFILTSAIPAHAQNIPSLEQFGATTSPVVGITQRVVNRPIIVTGISTGHCLELDGNHQLVATSTCNSLAAAITGFGPAGQIQVGPTILNATTSSTTNGLTSGLTITASGNTVTYTSASSGILTVPGGGTGANSLTGLVLGNGASAMTAYAGASCTNQFPRSQSASGAWTCATVGAADVSLANLSATDSTLTFSGTYTGSTARTIGINLSNPNAWTGLQQTLRASSTQLSAGIATFGATASSTFDGTGKLTLSVPLAYGSGGTGSTTAPVGQVIYGGATAYQSAGTTSATVSNGLMVKSGALGALIGGSNSTLGQIENRSFTYGTSTPTGTTTIPIAVGYGEVWNNGKCFTDVGTVAVDFYHASSHLDFIKSASTTVGTNSFVTNNTIPAGDKVYVDIGNWASSPTRVTCTVNDTN